MFCNTKYNNIEFTIISPWEERENFYLSGHDRNGFLDAVRSPFPLQGKLILMAKKRYFTPI